MKILCEALPNIDQTAFKAREYQLLIFYCFTADQLEIETSLTKYEVAWYHRCVKTMCYAINFELLTFPLFMRISQGIVL